MNKVFIAATNSNVFNFVKQHLFISKHDAVYINSAKDIEKVFGYRNCTLIIYGEAKSLKYIRDLVMFAKTRDFSIFVMDDESALYV
jgi:hypothetical protein